MTSASNLMKRMKIEEIPIEKLQLDPQNIRFQHLNKISSDQEIENLIWNEKDTKKLYTQIMVAAGLHEEPLVKRSGSSFVIIEGNRRVVCLRKLQEEANKGLISNTPKNKYDQVKCKVLPDDAEQTDIDLLLITLHVKSKKEWATFNRAKLITDLHESGLSYDKLTKHLAMGKITIIRYVDSYTTTLNYGKEFPGEGWFQKFIYFEELFKKRDLKEWREDPKNVKEFFGWVHSKKFRESKDVRMLGRIVSDKKVLEKFRRSNFIEALKLIEDLDPTLKSQAFKRIKKAIDIMRAFPRRELIKTSKDSSRILLLKELKSEVTKLLKDLDDMER